MIHLGVETLLKKNETPHKPSIILHYNDKSVATEYFYTTNGQFD